MPDGLNIDNIKQELLNQEGVLTVHHIHLWAISTTQNGLTAHIVVSNTLTHATIATIKKKCKHCLEVMNITHATLEIETDELLCVTNKC